MPRGGEGLGRAWFLGVPGFWGALGFWACLVFARAERRVRVCRVLVRIGRYKVLIVIGVNKL